MMNEKDHRRRNARYQNTQRRKNKALAAHYCDLLDTWIRHYINRLEQNLQRIDELAVTDEDAQITQKIKHEITDLKLTYAALKSGGKKAQAYARQLTKKKPEPYWMVQPLPLRSFSTEPPELPEHPVKKFITAKDFDDAIATEIRALNSYADAHIRKDADIEQRKK